MIRPLRRLHASLLPLLAVLVALLVLISVIGRAPEPEMTSWPDAIERRDRGSDVP